MTDETSYVVVEFQDGLQLIPRNWLDLNTMKAFGQILRVIKDTTQL